MERKKKHNLSNGEKILAKGDPGMGIAMWCKKFTRDWAKGFFTAFSVISLCLSNLSNMVLQYITL